MDGTLVDSEVFTEKIISDYLGERNLNPDGIEYEDFHGVTWIDIANSLSARWPNLDALQVADEFSRRFHETVQAQPPTMIAGADKAVRAAAKHFSCAIVSSSGRKTVAQVIKQLDLEVYLKCRVCADDVRCAKPNPECYLQAAERLSVQAEACLVFEDSLAGLSAANAAGMWTVAITHHKSDEAKKRSRAKAHYSIAHFDELPDDFFERLSEKL
jgi:sugar-phosphatase